MNSVPEPTTPFSDLTDTLLQAGATLDWLSPTVAVIQSAINGPSHTFLIPRECGLSGHAIVQMLAEHGVRTWGQMVVCDTIMFTVRQAQARWAEYLLQRAGIPIISRPVAEKSLSLPPLPGRLTPAGVARWLGRCLKHLWRVADLSSLL